MNQEDKIKVLEIFNKFEKKMIVREAPKLKAVFEIKESDWQKLKSSILKEFEELKKERDEIK